MKAFTAPIAHLPPSQCLAPGAASSSASCRGRSCANDSLPRSGTPLLASASVRANEGKSLRRFLPSEQRHSIRSRNVVRAETGKSATNATVQEPKASDVEGVVAEEEVPKIPDRVKHVTTIKEFDEALVAAKNKLVVVEYAATHSKNSRKIYPAMVDLSRTFKGVVFLLVLGDESEETKELCERAGVRKVPHFMFYKNSQKIHEEEGITSEVLEGDVLYYGDIDDAPIIEVKSRSDFDVLVKEHASDNKLVVIDIGLKSCGPCAKVYPTFVKLAKRMEETTVFARMHGDENPECALIIKSMGVKEVPTFLFMRDGEPLGRYVGSGRGELVGEILKHNGVFEDLSARR